VPALVQAVQNQNNLDLRVCAVHSLGQIGDVSAVDFLAKRAADVSLPDDDRVSAVMALGEIGSPNALPALESIVNNAAHPLMRSFALSAIRQIGFLQGDAESKLLAVLGDNSGWIRDDWILAQLYRRWDDRIATGLNKILRTDTHLQSGLRLHIAALLTAQQSMEPTTLQALGDSQNQEDRWLANLAERNPSDVQLLANHP
jgi:HEAT repeat protein